MENRQIPWMVSALAFPLHFFIVYDSLNAAFPAFAYFGLLPAVLVIPQLMGLWQLVRRVPAGSRHRSALLAWFSGTALFFITLVFPVQFSNQWLTIGWALEGLGLLALFRRLPHPGLRLAGVVLLGVAFARLALNPAGLFYQERSGTPVLNWYLYVYGIVTACLMLGGRLLARERWFLRGIDVSAVVYGMGTLLAFFLVNIEITDFFSTGPYLSFNLSGNFAQDITYVDHRLIFLPAFSASPGSKEANDTQETPEPVFTRTVTLSQQQVVQNEIQEKILSRDTI